MFKLNRLAIIPARGGSKRIKNKNLVNFNGKPIISYKLRMLKNLNYLIRFIFQQIVVKY